MKLFKNMNIRKNSLEVLKKYPIVLICSYIIGVLSILFNHDIITDEDIFAKILICIGLFAANALIFNGLSKQYEKFTKKIHIIALLLSAAACFGYYFTLNPDMEFSIIRTLVIFFSQALIYISIPFIKEDIKTEHFVNLIVGRLIITMCMFFVAWGGIAGIFFALEELFGLYIPNELYNDIPIVLASTFVPMVWLFGIRYNIEPKTTKLYRLLLVYVLMTLLIAYTAVVYGYILKIVFSGFKMPSSIICNLVLWYSLVGMAVYYLSRCYAKDGYGKFFITWYPRASVLPLVIMFISLFMRVNQYGYTVNRLYMLLGGIYLAIMTCYILYSQIRRTSIMHILIPIVMAVIALLSIIEPFSVNTIRLKSQQKQLESLVEQYKSSGTLDIESMSDKDCIRAQNIVRYISHKTESEYPYTYKEINCLTEDETTALMDEFRITEEHVYDDQGKYYDSVYKETEYIDIGGYTYIAELYTHENTITMDNISIEIIVEYGVDESGADYYNNYGSDVTIEYTKDETTLASIPLSQMYLDKMEEAGSSFGEEDEDYIVEIIEDDYSIKFIMRSIDFVVYENGKREINYINGYVLVK